MQLWITRVSCAAKEHDINYSRFVNGLVKVYVTHSLPIIIPLRVTDSLFVQCDIQLNRKVLSELAIHEPRSFQVLYIVYIPCTTYIPPPGT